MRATRPPEKTVPSSTGDFVFQFGPYKLDPAERSLTRAGESVPLTPKAFDTLCVLVENSGRLVSKEQLLERIWPETYVEEKTLAQNIFTLRKALGLDSNRREYIETVPKKGYRFAFSVQTVPRRPAPVTELRLASTELDTNQQFSSGTRRHPRQEPRGNRASQLIVDRWKRATAPLVKAMASGERLPRVAVIAASVIAVAVVVIYSLNQRQSSAAAVPRSVAVLPFKSLGSSQELEVVGLGMANSVIVDLSSMTGLTVLPTSSVFKYTQRDKDAIAIGRALGVDAVLDGTIQQSDDKVHVTALLIRTSDGKSLWSGKFDGNSTDTFRLQDSISRELSSTLAANIQGEDQRSRKQPHNLAAYNSYLFGLFFWNKRDPEDVTKAISYLEQSVQQDANLAVAHALLAQCYFHIAGMNPRGPVRSDAIARTRVEVTRALEIDSNLSDAYTVLAYLALDAGDFSTGEQHFRHALELDPNNGEAHLQYGGFLYTQARLSEANVELERAQQLAPLSPQIAHSRTVVLFMLRDYDGVIAAARQALEVRPDYDGLHVQLAEAYAVKGMFQQALDATKAIKDPLLSLRSKVFVEGLAARTSEAKRTLEELERSQMEKKLTPYQQAVLYSAAGDKTMAFDSLTKAIDEAGKRESKQFLEMLLKFDPQLDGLRSDSRFGHQLSRLQ